MLPVNHNNRKFKPRALCLFPERAHLLALLRRRRSQGDVTRTRPSSVRARSRHPRRHEPRVSFTRSGIHIGACEKNQEVQAYTWRVCLPPLRNVLFLRTRPSADKSWGTRRGSSDGSNSSDGTVRAPTKRRLWPDEGGGATPRMDRGTRRPSSASPLRSTRAAEKKPEPSSKNGTGTEGSCCAYCFLSLSPMLHCKLTRQQLALTPEDAKVGMCAWVLAGEGASLESFAGFKYVRLCLHPTPSGCTCSRF